jgi:hypothetical protein
MSRQAGASSSSLFQFRHGVVLLIHSVRPRQSEAASARPNRTPIRSAFDTLVWSEWEEGSDREEESGVAAAGG